MTKEEILNYATGLDGAVCDNPFNEDFFTTVLRHKASKKWFGILLNAPKEKVGVKGEGEVEVLNLKCDPVLAKGLFEAYCGIMPAYHMNKYHWISVVLDSDVPFNEVKGLISLSYSLTEGKRSLHNN